MQTATTTTGEGFTVEANGFADDLVRFEGFGSDGDYSRTLSKAEAESIAIRHAVALKSAKREGANIIIRRDGAVVRDNTLRGGRWAPTR